MHDDLGPDDSTRHIRWQFVLANDPGVEGGSHGRSYIAFLLFEPTFWRVGGRIAREQPATAWHRALPDGSVRLELDLRDEHVSQVHVRLRMPSQGWLGGIGPVTNWSVGAAFLDLPGTVLPP